MTDLNDRPNPEAIARPRPEGQGRGEPELADLISAWYEAARAQQLARRRLSTRPSAPGAQAWHAPGIGY
jgi:hypothetical protein